MYVQKEFMKQIIFYGTSWILVATGPQDPTARLTQYFWMDIAPPIFVANNN